ncbi:MAG TPA: CBS domain-containing protein, partial [Parasegetibacter sp.]
MEIEKQNLQEQFEAILEGNDQLQFSDFLNHQNISEVAELIYEYPDYAAQIIAGLSIHRAVGAFRILDFPVQKKIIQGLPPHKAAELLNELPADDRTSFLEELPTEVVREMIKTLNPEERKITLSLLGYPEDSVGRLMTPDYIAIQESWTVQQVLEHIRKNGSDSETIDVLYVVNDNGQLIDDIRIRDFLFAAPEKRVGDMIDGRFIALNVNDDQEVANNIFKMNNRTALPVVDDQNILLGIVTIDDVLWIANEEFSEDIQKIGGTEALDEPYLEMPIFRLFRKRVGWMIILFLGEMLTATAMGYFEDEIQKA